LTKAAAPKRMGRPPLPPQARKTTNLTFRARGDLREKLSAAAAISGRSVSEEIERILEGHFSNQNVVTMALGGGQAAELVRPLLSFLSQLERAGIEWRGNEEIAPVVEACVGVMVEAAARGQPFSYDEWYQRIWTGCRPYNALAMTDRGPDLKIRDMAALVIQIYGLGELEPEISREASASTE
jgi:hypothetical protein